MEISYLDLRSKLIAAYKAKAKMENDPYAEVKVRCYCGGGFEMDVTCTKAEFDEDDDEFLPAFYMQYVSEDPDFDFDMGFSVEDFKYGIKEYYQENGDVHEMTKTVQISDSELSRLEDIANGQSMLFESVLRGTLVRR